MNSRLTDGNIHTPVGDQFGTARFINIFWGWWFKIFKLSGFLGLFFNLDQGKKTGKLGNHDGHLEYVSLHGYNDFLAWLRVEVDQSKFVLMSGAIFHIALWLKINSIFCKIFFLHFRRFFFKYTHTYSLFAHWYNF